MRCAVCGISWPYDQRFVVCPQCEQQTERFLLDENDCALTMREADDLLTEFGLKARPSAVMGTGYRPRASSIRNKLNPADELRRLHDDLDHWAKEAPAWLKH